VAKIQEQFDFGDIKGMTIENLMPILDKMYSDLAKEINKKPDLFERSTNGQAGDTFLSNGTLNINTTTQKVEMLTKHVTPATVTWKTLS
jgi:hypothetical protein